MKNIALALGEIDEAMGLLNGRDTEGGLISPGRHMLRMLDAYKALVRAREFLAEATAVEAARVPVAHFTPITTEEVARSDETWPLSPVPSTLAEDVGP